MYTHESELRGVFADFLEMPESAATTWSSLRTCSLAYGVYQCTRKGLQFCDLNTWAPRTPSVPWSFSATKPWDSYPASSQCPAVGGGDDTFNMDLPCHGHPKGGGGQVCDSPAGGFASAAAPSPGPLAKAVHMAMHYMYTREY